MYICKLETLYVHRGDDVLYYLAKACISMLYVAIMHTIVIKFDNICIICIFACTQLSS